MTPKGMWIFKNEINDCIFTAQPLLSFKAWEMSVAPQWNACSVSMAMSP